VLRVDGYKLLGTCTFPVHRKPNSIVKPHTMKGRDFNGPLGQGEIRNQSRGREHNRMPEGFSVSEGRPLAPAYGFKERRTTMNGRASVWDNSSADWLKQLASNDRTFLPPLSIVRSRKAARDAAQAK